MYTTLDGAKKRAGTLFHAFEDSGILFPLHRCQQALSRAGGFDDWHTLVRSIAAHPPTCDRDQFRHGLMMALPAPCRQAALAWIESLPRQPFPESGRPPFFIYDVGPYAFHAATSYRRNQPLIRIGSGPGQRLRESLVMGRVMRAYDQTGPWLDPDTCALIYRGTRAEIFEKDAANPRFEVEFGVLIEAGVFEWIPGGSPNHPGILKLLPSVGVDLTNDVTEHHGVKVGQWFERPGPEAPVISALWEGLASLGIADGKRIATALVSQGAPGYITESGPVLTVLSELAAAGAFETLARAVVLFSAMHPKNGAFVKRSVPAKIGSQYFARHPRLKVSQLLAWDKQHPQWQDEVIAALDVPASFSWTVDHMVDEIAALAA